MKYPGIILYYFDLTFFTFVPRMGLRWCRDNDEKCQQIAKNAQELYRTYVSREGILDYMQVGTVVLEHAGDDSIA